MLYLILLVYFFSSTGAQHQCKVPHIDLETGLVTVNPIECRFGQCVRNKSFGQLIYKSKSAGPEVVRFTGSDYCLCAPGYFGRQCEFECPLKNCAERHVYPLHNVRHSEKCGQLFYENEALADLRSLPVTGLCSCPPPLLGEACQFSLKSGDPLRYFQQDLQRFAGQLRASDHITPTLQNLQTSALPTICGKHGVFNLSDASCTCHPGWLSTSSLSSLRTESPQQKVDQGAGAAGTWHMPSNEPTPTWEYSHIPLCALPHAKFTALKMADDTLTSSSAETSVRALVSFRAKVGHDQDGSPFGMPGITVDECIVLLSEPNVQKDDLQDCTLLAQKIAEANVDDVWITRAGNLRGLGAASSSSPNSGLSSAAIAGIVIAAVAALVICIACICLWGPRPKGCCGCGSLVVLGDGGETTYGSNDDDVKFGEPPSSFLGQEEQEEREEGRYDI